MESEKQTQRRLADHFLEKPGRSRWSDLTSAIGIGFEFIKGFRSLHFVGPCITVFGSASMKEENGYYTLAREMGTAIAKSGFTVMTGGGPGIMEAANRGAYEADGPSVGCNIVLPDEQDPNTYLDTFVTFKHFFVRKVLLLKYSYAFVVMPGGSGTMDEMFETLTLIQTKKIEPFPFVLMGKEYWQNLMELLQDMVDQGTIGENYLELFLVTDSVEEAMAHIETTLRKTIPTEQRTVRKKPFLLFGERYPSKRIRDIVRARAKKKQPK